MELKLIWQLLINCKTMLNKCLFLPKGSSQQEADEASPDDDDDNQPAGESRGGTGGENAVAIKLVILILYKLQTIIEPPHLLKKISKSSV